MAAGKRLTTWPGAKGFPPGTSGPVQPGFIESEETDFLSATEVAQVTSAGQADSHNDNFYSVAPGVGRPQRTMLYVFTKK